MRFDLTFMRTEIINNCLSRAVGVTLLGAILLVAQTSNATLRGVVTDPSSGVVPNATVSLLRGSSQVKTAATDGTGHFQMNGLPPGPYTVRATATGFSSFELNSYEIRAGQSQLLDISLQLKAQADQVTVAADAAAVVDTEPSNNAGALVLVSADLDALPDDPDDLSADLQALAGPAAGPNGGQFFIDGFTGGRLPPKQSIREIRVNQNPFAAQFDHPGHGRVEIFTKPGSDEFHGDVLFQFSDASLNTRNPFVSVRPPYQRRQWEGEVGGALGKKTSFMADFERRDISENAFVNAVVLDDSLKPVPFSTAIVTPVTGIEGNVRLDRQLTTNHTLTARYGYARDTNDNGGVGGFSLPERAYQVASSEHTWQLLETGVLNQHTVNETRFRVRRQATDQNGRNSAPVINVLDAFTSGGSAVGQSFDRQTRYEIQNFTSWVHGTHTLRFGGLARIVALDNQAKLNYSGTFTFTSLDAWRLTQLGIQQHLSPAAIRLSGGGPSQFSLSAGDPLANVTQSDYGVFIQDDWRVRQNVTLSVGARYETQTNSGDRSDIAPRVAIAWAVGRGKSAPKNVIRAGAGIFYDRLSESLTLDAMRQNGIRQQQFLIPTPDFYPNIPDAASLLAAAQPQTIRRTDSNWRAPMMVQASVGFERQLPKHITVSTNYLHTGGSHAVRSRNINAPRSGTSTLPFGGVNAIYLYETSGVFRQNQLISNLNARVSSKLTFSGSYVYGSAVSNSDGAGTFPSNQYDLSTEMGPALFNVRHRFQMNGSLSTRWGLRFSPFVTMTSGRPFNITTGKDLNGDGLFTDRPGLIVGQSTAGVNTPYGRLDPAPLYGETLLPRNFGVGPGVIAANLRVSKSFNIGRHDPHKDSSRQIVLSANGRNVLNHPNLAAPNGNLSSPLFGRSTSLASGGGGGGGGVSGNRRIDLQLRFNF
ncbi:MAG: Cna domain protein [Bryobacterales bacterium]|nr:Cna domain protein [Bryobacterales bacterium]